MTTVKIRAVSPCRLTARGHATGSPEVCAAVSGIVYGLAGYLKTEAGNHQITPEITISSGDVEIQSGGDKCLEAVFEMVMIALMQIERKYPEYLRVEWEE